jgi:spore coat protein U-like protein
MRVTFRTIGLGLAGAAALAGVSAPAQAARNGGGLALGATVDSECTVTATDLAFGILDTQNVTTVDAEGTVTVACASTTVFKIQLDFGENATGQQRRIKNAAGDFLPYEVYRNANRTQRWALIPVQSRNGVIVGGGTEDFEAYGTLSGISPTTPKGYYVDNLTVMITF